MENLEPVLVGSIQKAQFIHTFVGAPLIDTVATVPSLTSVSVMEITYLVNRYLQLSFKAFFSQMTKLLSDRGRAIAQAVSRWLPTAAARVRAQVWSCGICGGQSGAGAGFLRVILVSPANLHSTNCSTVTLIYHLGFVQ
jgi:hypothetical protein